MLKDTSKELDFYTDFKYNLVFVIKSYEPEKNFLFWKIG